MEPSLPPEVLAEIRDLVAARRKIDAIKRMREATGLGLKEAKDAVESIEADSTLVRFRSSGPQPQVPTPSGGLPSNTVSKSGCFSVMILLATSAGALAWLAFA